MSLGVGINENVAISPKCKIDVEKKTFDLVFKTKTVTDIFSALISGDSLQDEEVTLKQFPLSMTDFDNNTKSAATIGQELGAFKETLKEILGIYMDAASTEKAMSMQPIFASVGITEATKGSLMTQLQNEEFVTNVFLKIANAFIIASQPFVDGDAFRLKLIRSSKKKHYPRIPYKGKFPEVWIEPMLVAKEMSKISFSKWEIENGRNDGTPEQADTADAGSVAAAEAAFMVPGTEAPAAAFVQPAATPAVEVAVPVAQVVAPDAPSQFPTDAEGDLPF